MSKEVWNKRFGTEKYVYGELPNEYLKEKLKELTPGKILFPAEGEGRNAVFAASRSWEAFAFDQSEKGKEKAVALAEKKGVHIEYEITDGSEIPFKEEKFDAAVLIYAHFPADKRSQFFKEISNRIKPGGALILEGFSKDQPAYREKYPKSGGPQDVALLFDLEEIKSDFEDFEFEEAQKVEIELNEGENHRGKASVIRLFGFKK